MKNPNKEPLPEYYKNINEPLNHIINITPLKPMEEKKLKLYNWENDDYYNTEAPNKEAPIKGIVRQGRASVVNELQEGPQQ